MAHDTFVQDGEALCSTDFTALNNSGVAGRAVLLLDQDAHTVTVDIEASGLEPGQIGGVREMLEGSTLRVSRPPA